MRRLAALVALGFMAACSSSSSSGSCTAGQACTPSGAPNVCASYATACDASGNTTCVATTLADGTSCGTGKVCVSSACVNACVPNVTCTPTGTLEACKTYSTTCSAALTSTTCAVSGNKADGTSCGSGLVCDTGACVTACTAGVTCVPAGAADPCKNYATSCSSDLAQAFCVAATNKADGTSCGTSGQTCTAGTCTGALAAPTLTPTGGTFAPGVSVRIAHADPTAVIFYTTNGTAPSDAPETFSPSFTGSGTVVLQATSLIQAFAKVGTVKSPTVSGVYTITQPPPPPPPTPPTPVINLAGGFTTDSVQRNGSATIVGTRLRLTPSNTRYQFASAFFPTTVNVQGFTTDFQFQVTVDDPRNIGDGITFTIQGEGPFALGSQGGGLGYGPDPFLFGQILKITKSVAIKFDLFDNNGEGTNSTGIYTDGQVPTIPFLNLSPSGIVLENGHVFHVHLVYDGTTLNMTVTDPAISPVPRFTASFPIDIAAHVGAQNAWVGFTGSTGGLTSQFEILNWTFTNVR